VDDARGRYEGRVDLVDVGVGQRAADRQRFVDLLIELGVVAGRVIVPDLVEARRGGLTQRLDLAERDLVERHHWFVLVRPPGHWPDLRSRGKPRVPTHATLAIDPPPGTLGNGNEFEVNAGGCERRTRRTGMLAGAANQRLFSPGFSSNQPAITPSG